jgi:hypothetical protein
MQVINLYAHNRSGKKTRSLLTIIAVFLIVLGFLGTIRQAHGDGLGLESLPVPFVTPAGAMNCSIVVTSSVGHGPCGAAHTMDVVGAIMVAGQLGLKTDSGTLDATMDDYISSYDFDTAKVELKDLSSNLVVVGGPGVNQITWYYNNLRNGSGGRVLPVYFDKYPNGTDYVCVASTGHTYKIEFDSLGRVKADYGVVTTFHDGGRYVMILAGLGGLGTWSSCKVVSSFENWNMHGSAAVVKYADGNGDGFLDEISIVESSSSPLTISVFGPVGLGLLLIPLAPNIKTLWRKIGSKRLLSRAALVLLIAVASQISLAAFSSGDTGSEVFTLKDFSRPFISSGGSFNCTVVVASSVGHGPCGAAHTMDVVGAIMVGAELGLDANGGSLSSSLDDCASTYDLATAQISFPSSTNNLLVLGGPGVNQVTWYYNNLRNSTGAKALPVYFDKYPNGTDCIRVSSTGHSYAIEQDSLGRVKTDYGFITLYYDAEHGVWVLIVAGLGGAATMAASRLLATYRSWSIFGRASVVKVTDSNADGYVDTTSIVESVGFGKSIDVYSDANCISSLQSINWGTLSPGDRKNVTIYVRNEGETSTVLALNASGWSPIEALDFMGISWNYSGSILPSGQTMPIMLTLTVDPNITGITDFDVNIDVNSS